jgi:hypothetical protein
LRFEAIEYIAILTIDGGTYPPFLTYFSAGESTGVLQFSWLVRVVKPNLTARFQLIGITVDSGVGKEFIDTWRIYHVPGRL